MHIDRLYLTIFLMVAVRGRLMIQVYIQLSDHCFISVSVPIK